MQYFANFSNAVPASGSSESHQPIAVPIAEMRSRMAENTVDLGAAQRAAISKAYGDILLNGGHFGC
jgi:hypothetical protein